MEINKESNTGEFLTLVASNLSNREGIDSLLNYITKETDFFEAPASSKFHLNVEGGLCRHSLNVYEILSHLCSLYYEDVSKESLILVSLFHDLCKANMYKIQFKNIQKNGNWTKEPQYIVDDKFPIGHGEKSVIILQKFIKLTDEEIYAIRWHMNGFDNAIKGGDFGLNNALNKKEGRLLTLLICADQIASNIYELEV